MSIDSAILTGKTIANIVLGRETDAKIEKELNEHLSGWEREFTNYNGETIEVELESITVRPMYGPKGDRSGIQQVESKTMFTNLEAERDDPNLKEQISASIKGEWITIVRLNILNGDSEDIRPEGLNLRWVTTHIFLRTGGHPFRISKTNPVESDKIEMKIPYHGSIGEYRQQVSDTLDLLEYLQDNMEEYAVRFLIELYHSGLGSEDSDSVWPDEEMARKVGEYLAGGPVDLDRLATVTGNIKTEIEEATEEE